MVLGKGLGFGEVNVPALLPGYDSGGGTHLHSLFSNGSFVRGLARSGADGFVFYLNARQAVG